MDTNKKGSLADRINFGGKNKAQEKPEQKPSPWIKMGN